MYWFTGLISSVSAHLTDWSWGSSRSSKICSPRISGSAALLLECCSLQEDFLYKIRAIRKATSDHNQMAAKEVGCKPHHINLAGDRFSLLDWLKPYKVRLCQHNWISCSFYGVICRLLSHRETIYRLKVPILRILDVCIYKIEKKIKNQ